jgi:hypothetical protein
VRDHFTAWYPLDDEQREKFIREGLVALDTNILLDLYRMNADARQDLLSLLKQLGNRLWVPNQVALEFHRNRFNVIYDQQDIIEKTRKVISESATKLREAVSQLRDHPVIDRRLLGDTINSAFAQINIYLDEACKEPVLSIEAARRGDPVLDAVTELLSGRVGKAYDPDRMAKVTAEAKKRIQDKRPPGYADAKKEEDKKVGDYVLWRQLMDEANQRMVPTLLITNDQKEDWYRRLHGITIGPRPELIEEMLQESGVSFHAQTLARFIQNASPVLKPVKDATVSEVNRLDTERRVESSQQRIFDDVRRSQLLKDTSTASRTDSGTEGMRLRDARDEALRTIGRLEAELLETYRSAEGESSGETADPRSYVRALEVQLENARLVLNEIEAQYRTIQNNSTGNDLLYSGFSFGAV